jgi:hypothetical protein
MTTTKITFDQKIDNIQHQLDTMNRGDAAFKGYVHRQLGLITETMATKEDLYKLEDRLTGKMATKEGLYNLEDRLKSELATKGDLGNLTKIVTKIAEKVGVN